MREAQICCAVTRGSGTGAATGSATSTGAEGAGASAAALRGSDEVCAVAGVGAVGEVALRGRAAALCEGRGSARSGTTETALVPLAGTADSGAEAGTEAADGAGMGWLAADAGSAPDAGRAAAGSAAEDGALAAGNGTDAALAGAADGTIVGEVGAKNHHAPAARITATAPISASAGVRRTGFGIVR